MIIKPIYLYFCLIIILFIYSKTNSLIYLYAAYFLLGIPIVFISEKQLGIKNLKSLVMGLVFSLIYMPFLKEKLFLPNLFLKAFFEEVFFRSYLQNTFQNNLNIHLSIIITSILFTIPHILINSEIISILVFIPSILFGYLYAFNKSIWTSSIFHYFSNLFYIQNKEIINKILEKALSN